MLVSGQGEHADNEIKEGLMPYNRIEELPDSVRKNLPEHAQHIFLEAYNNAWQQYSNPSERRGESSLEETAMKVAWAAVKKEYTKNERTGKWESKKVGSKQ